MLAVKIGAKAAKWRVAVFFLLLTLPSDGMVRLSTEEHAQFAALVEEYFNTSNGSDDASSGSDDEMECGKYLWYVNIKMLFYTVQNEQDDNSDIHFNREGKHTQ